VDGVLWINIIKDRSRKNEERDGNDTGFHSFLWGLEAIIPP
jgi:hypothetical protein